MLAELFARHEGLRKSRRWEIASSAGRRAVAVELVALGLCGVGAAVLTSVWHTGLRLPGHAILRAVFPMALGMALAPRRGGGTVMGLSAGLSSVALRSLHIGHLGVGATTSLFLLGSLFDLFLARVRNRRGIVFGLALAGMTANMAAYVVRGGFKWAAVQGAGGRPLDEWWLVALGSYLLCGLAAGLLSGLLCFRSVSRAEVSDETAMR